MCPDPYINNLLDQELPCKEKPDLVGKIVCVLHARAENRGLQLCPFPSRAVLKHEVHELIVTAEETARPGAVVNQIAYTAFFEVLESGMLWAGDRLLINGLPAGYLVGYDFAHMPNHMNIIVQAGAPLKTGYEAGLHPGDEIRFVFTHGQRE
jgi:hypothetical protein